MIHYVLLERVKSISIHVEIMESILMFNNDLKSFQSLIDNHSADITFFTIIAKKKKPSQIKYIEWLAYEHDQKKREL